MPSERDDSGSPRLLRYRRIAVAVDGSPCSAKALEEAVGLAKCAGSELSVLHVMVVSSALFSADVRQPIEGVEREKREQGERLVAAASAEARRHGVEAKEVLVEAMDSAVTGIAHYMAENDVDLLVVGTRGLTGVRRLFVGSVASGVVRCAPCTVMVVK